MIGQIICDKDGQPLDHSGNKLSPSSYQPSHEVMDLFAKVQHDYQIGYQLQHRPLKEFDGVSMLERAKRDQETFGAYVGCEYVPAHKKWRWKGRKNTARNKLIYILSRAIAGMLYPHVSAKNDQNEQDKNTGRVMQILVKDYLEKANYKMNFLFMVLSALVNPAVFVEVEFVEALIKIKKKLADGTYTVIEAVDQLLTGLQINIVPVDEIMIPDYFSGTGKLQNLPCILRIRRIPWDQARAENAGCYFDKDGKDLFDYVQAGKTRIFIAGQENQMLYDIEWTEADKSYVQEITAYYRSEDLEVKFIGGVGMINEDNVYNANPFSHRRMTLIDEEWLSIPVYPYAASGFEPLDPAGRFFWFKSGAFKEYWDDATLNKMHQLAVDGTYLDVIKPTIVSGLAKVDSTVMVPGGTFGVPAGSQVSQYQLGPNLQAAWQAVQKQNQDMEDSTRANPIDTQSGANKTATETDAALQQARLFFTVFALFIAELVKNVGELTMDCVVQNATMGELNNTIPGALAMKFKTFLAHGKEKGKNITHRIEFTDKHMGREYTDEKLDELKWGLSDRINNIKRDKKGRKISGENELESDQLLYEVNPYQFARYTYTMSVDPDEIILKSLGAEKSEKMKSFNILTDPRVAPFTDMQAVVEDFAIEEYGGDDPDKYKKKSNPNDMLNGMMNGQGAPPGAAAPGAPVVPPTQTPQVTQ